MSKRSADVQPLSEERAASDFAVICQNLSKRFLVMDRGDAWRLLFSQTPKGSRSFEALRNISINVPKGEFVGILGRNGAGKSTLLRTVGGVFTPSKGFVHLGDRVSGIYELGIAGHDLLTGRQFVERWLKLNGERSSAIPDMVEEIYEFTELEDYFDQPIRTYSTGMQARLFFATITAVTATIYLIDEIMSVGDEYYSAKCQGRLRRRLSSGASGLFATHDWAAMLRICSHAFVLDQGHVVDSGTAAEVAARYIEPASLIPEGASFAPEMANLFNARAGEDAVWRFPIEKTIEDEMAFSMSVEFFQPSYGWQHVLHVSPTLVEEGAGHHEIVVRVPRLPLGAGRYLINAFLTRPKRDAEGEYNAYAARSWLYGNPIELQVEGPRVNGNTHLEFDWSVQKLSS